MAAFILYRNSVPTIGPASTSAKSASLTFDELDANFYSLVQELLTKAPTASPTFTGTVGGITKAMVGLDQVDNTTDANKPISTAQAAVNALKAPIASPSFTGTVSGVTSAMVGLGNVDNTSDVNKPVSTAQATAIALKAPIANPTFTGTTVVPTLNVGAQYSNSVTSSGSGAQSLDTSTQDVFKFTLTGATTTFTFTNAPTSGKYKQVLVILVQDGTGNRLATFTGAKYTDGVVPILSTAANAIDVLSFFTIDGGTTWFGSFVMAAVA